MNTALTLYVDAGFLSPYAMSVYVALSEKALPFEVRLVDLAEHEQHSPAYQRRAPTARVPALSHEHFHLSESSAIAEYLEDTFPSPEYPALYPADRHERARARQIQAWLRSDLLALRQERPTETVFHTSTQAPLSQAAQTAAAKLLRVVEGLLKPGQTTLFTHWSIVDIDLALMLKRLHATNERPDWMGDYTETQWQRKTVQNWLNNNRAARY